MAVQLLSNNPMEINMKDIASYERNVYQTNALVPSLTQYNSAIRDDYQGSAQFEIAVSNFYARLLSSQEPLGIEFEKVLYNNLWELYES